MEYGVKLKLTSTGHSAQSKRERVGGKERPAWKPVHEYLVATASVLSIQVVFSLFFSDVEAEV